MNIKLDRVKLEEKEVLYRLLQYSLFEESLTDGNEMNDQAVFEYKWFDDYFVEEVREAYFIREAETNKLLGFVMINPYLRQIDSGHSIAEFMVLPNYRRNKVGKQAAIKCFDKYDGSWEVHPADGSQKAYLFWKNVIDEYTEHNNKFEDGFFTFNK